MKQYILFLLLFMPFFAFSQGTNKDTVKVLPFDSLSSIGWTSLDTSDQIFIYDSGTQTFAYRATWGQILRAVDTTYLGTKRYVDSSEITFKDIMALGTDYLADGGDSTDFKITNADQIVLNSNGTIQLFTDSFNLNLIAQLGTIRMQGGSYRMIGLDEASATESDTLVGLLGITSVNDSVELFKFSDLMFDFVGDSVLVDTSYFASKEYVNSSMSSSPGLDSLIQSGKTFTFYAGDSTYSMQSIDTFIFDNGSYKIVVGTDTLDASLTVDFGNRVYFSKELGNNATGQRGNPNKPFADPWTAWDNALQGDIVTGLTVDTFNLQIGSDSLGTGDWYAYDGGVRSSASGSDRNISVHFVDGSVIKTNNATYGFNAKVNNNSIDIRNLKVIGVSGNQNDILAYSPTSTTKDELRLENFEFDSVGQVVVRSWKTDLFITGDSWQTLEPSATQDILVDEFLDNSILVVDIKNTNFYFDNMYWYGLFPSRRVNVDVNIFNTNPNQIRFYIEGAERSNIKYTINSEASNTLVYCDSTVSNLDIYVNALESSPSQSSEVFAVGGNGSYYNINVNGKVKSAGTNGMGSFGSSGNTFKLIGRVDFIESPAYLFNFNTDSTSIVYYDNFYVTGLDGAVFNRQFTNNELMNMTFTDSYIETADSNFFDLTTIFNHNNNPIKFQNTTIKYVGTDNPTSYLYPNAQYVMDNFRLNIPEFDNQSDYDSQITYINNESIEDKIKSQNVTLNGNSNTLSIIGTTDQNYLSTRDASIGGYRQTIVGLNDSSSNTIIQADSLIRLEDAQNIIVGTNQNDYSTMSPTTSDDDIEYVFVQDESGFLKKTTRLLPMFDTLTMTGSTDTFNLDYAMDMSLTMDATSASATTTITIENPVPGTTLDFSFINVGSTITVNFSHYDRSDHTSQSSFTVSADGDKMFRYKPDGNWWSTN